MKRKPNSHDRSDKGKARTPKLYKGSRSLDQAGQNWKYHNDPEYRAARKARDVDRKARNRERNQKYLGDYLKANSCQDCGEDDILILDFHHTSPQIEGDVGVPRLVSQGCSLERLDKEIAKCIVVCCRCHLKRHNRAPKKSLKEVRKHRLNSWRKDYV